MIQNKHFTMSSSMKFSLFGEIKNQLLSWEKLETLSLATAALFGLVSSASELWISQQNSIFQKINVIMGLLFLNLLVWSLFILYCKEWSRLTFQKVSIRMFIFAFCCTLFNSLIMYLLTLIIYLAIGDLKSFNFYYLSNLLYIAIPFALGEFSLKSTISRQLTRAKKLEKDAEITLQNIKVLVKSLEESDQKKILLSRLEDGFWDDYP